MLRVGVVDYRYVLYEYARPWLLHTLRHVTNASQREEEQEQVRIRYIQHPEFLLLIALIRYIHVDVDVLRYNMKVR